MAAMLVLACPGCVVDLLEVNSSKLVTPVSQGASITDKPTVDRCNAAIAQSAAQYDPVAIKTDLAGPVRGPARGVRVATLFVEIDYLRKGRIEPRSATVTCTVGADGQVSVELKDG